MPRNVKDIPGKFAKGNADIKRNAEYQKSRYSSDNRVFPNFSHTRASEILTTYNDSDYLKIILNGVSSTNDAYFGDLAIAAVESGHSSGNMKDKVAAQETGFDDAVQMSIDTLFELAFQKTIRKLMDNPPELSSDDLTPGDGQTGNTKMTVLTPDEYNTLVGNIEGRGAVVSNFVLNVFKTFNFYIKRSEPWQVGAVDIPASYIIPFCSLQKLADIEAYVNSWYSNNGLARLHMDKFGVKYQPFKESMLEAREIKVHDPDAIAFFNHCPFAIYDGANPQLITYKKFDADGSEDHPYYFKDSPNESKIHAYAKLLHQYNATYNKYGGLLFYGNSAVPTTQNYTNTFIAGKYENSEFLGQSVGGSKNLHKLFFSTYKQTNTLNVSFTGTYLSGDLDSTTWPLAVDLDLKYGKGLDETKTDMIMVRQAISDMFG
jgi:hypothetical protein